MRLPSFKRLLKTDFGQDDQNLVEQLSNSLNNGIELLYQALNKRLTITDNLQATERDVFLQVTANGTPTAPLFVNIDFGAQVRNVFVGRVENLTNTNVYPTGGVFVSWINTQNGVQITNISGLTVRNNYSLRIVMFG